ncbi:MAG: hypothetical protein AB7I30_03160 [Isosphaeraceae bacterium]
MESSLHRALKRRYGEGGRTEVWINGFRVDAVSAEGAVIEVQSGPLAPLRAKLGRLLTGRSVSVVKPVVCRRRVVRRTTPDGADVSARMSPKRGVLADVFDDLVGLARVFPHPNLTIEVLGVAIDEVRVPRRRWPGYSVADRLLHEVLEQVTLREPADLWRLLPFRPREPFTTRDVAQRLGRSTSLAQRVAYCLLHSGAIEEVGKQGNRRVFVLAGTRGPALPTKG